MNSRARLKNLAAPSEVQMQNLFEVALTNAAALGLLINDLTTNQPNPNITPFRMWVASECGVSINLNVYALIDILEGRPHLNIREWAADMARSSGRSVAELLDEKLGKYASRRNAFDASFENGATFRYGALNGGNLGLPKYGSFCMILKKDFCNDFHNAVCLSGDSLEICFSGDNVSLESTKRSAAPYSQRDLLVAVTKYSHVKGLDVDAWRALVCNDTEYFEVIFTEVVRREDIEKIRISKGDHSSMWDIAFKSFKGGLGAAEKGLAFAFKRLRDAELDRRVVVEIVE